MPAAALNRYVPRLLVEWLTDEPEVRSRVVEGTGVFADLSGFTAMTEKLAAHGKSGAEEMGEILNDVFEPLLASAYDYGAGLVKWGGDAVLLLFDGPGHAARAVRAAWAMQNTIGRVGKVVTTRGPMRIRMSVGVHSGDFDLVLTRGRWREFVVTGPAASRTAAMEKIADAGQIVLSEATAARLENAVTRMLSEGAHLLVEPAEADLLPRHTSVTSTVDLSLAFDPALAAHLTSGVQEYEHRTVVAAFVEFAGADALRRERGTEALAVAIDTLVAEVQEAAASHDVVVLATDVAEDGGKILLTCGAPGAPGDDETRLLSAVRRIVHDDGPFALRAGVTAGRVFVGDFGAEFRRTYSIAGDSVNLAARLMAHAERGTVLTLPAVLERTPFTGTPVSAFTAKGKSGKVHAVAVTAPEVTGGPTHERLELVGRDATVTALLEHVTASATGAGHVIEVVGAAGIGKSRLLDELEARSPVRVMRADGDVYGRAVPFLPLERLVRRALGTRLDADPAEVGRRLAELTAERAPELVSWLPLVAVVAAAEVPGTSEVSMLDGDARADRLRRVTSDLLAALVPEPLLLVFNDVHVMDDATIAVVRQICADAGRRPWCVVLTRRDGDAGHGATFPDAVAVALEALDDDSADRLVVAAATEPLPTHRRRQIIERAGGNPLFLRALVLNVVAGADIDTLPTAVEGLISAHIDRLEPAERAWLRSAATLGMHVDPTLLDDILDEPRPIDLTSPRIAEFIRPDPDGTLVFAHHLVQLTAYEALPFRTRKTLHARAAYALERRAGDDVADDAPLLAIHCLRGERFDAAWQYARMAGRQARQRYALVEAAEAYARALEAGSHIPGLPAREVAAVAEELADLNFALGDADATERALKLARAKAKSDPHWLARLYLTTAKQRDQVGKHQDALRWISRGRALLADDRASHLRLRSEFAEFAAHVHHNQGSRQQQRTWAETAATEARASGDARREASALSVLTVVRAQAGERWDPSVVEKTLALHEGSGDLHERAVITSRLGVAAFYGGDLSAAERLYADSESLMMTSGLEVKSTAVAVNRAEVLVDQGRPTDAIAVLSPAIASLRAAHAAAYLPFALTLFGRAHLDLGDKISARSALLEARDLALASDDPRDLSESEQWLHVCGD